MIPASEASQLLLNYLQGVLTPEQATLLTDWRQASPENEAYFTSLTTDDRLSGQIRDHYTYRALAWEKIQAGTQLTITRKSPLAKIRVGWMRYAALVLLLAGTTGLLYKLHWEPQKEQQSRVAKTSPVIAPGRNTAVLTLSDGTGIRLDDAANGTLAIQGNTSVVKLKNGGLAYQAGNSSKGSGVLYNTVTTPNGGQYQISLPDGTKVWLNAASSIRFPTRFDKIRSVTITGEVYFEVTGNHNLPFIVSAGGVQVNVLGTRFNINSYMDEPVMQTTLLDGSIQVINNTLAQGTSTVQSVLLKPGEQAGIQRGHLAVQRNADLEQVVAWRKGLFSFHRANLQQVMRQLARWYDITVRYPVNIPTFTFAGELPNNLSLQEVLDALGESQVKYRLEGRVLFIESTN